MGSIFKLFIAGLFLISLSLKGIAQCNANFSYLVTGNKVTINDSSIAGSSGSYFLWDFGDTSFLTVGSNLISYVHTYSNPGTYNLCLKVSDSSNTCVDSLCETITVYSACHAELYVSQYSPWGIAFTVNSSTGGTSPMMELWDGKGSYIAQFWSPLQMQTIFSSSYFTSGIYHPMHVVSDSSNNCRDTAWASFTLFGDSGGCSAYYTRVDSGNTVTFTDSSSTVTNSKGYFWDFGNWNASGNTKYNSGPNQTVVYNYPQNGSYRACFTVIDSSISCASKYCETVVIGPPECKANFQVIYYNGQHRFTSYSKSSYGYKFVWDFGDGTQDSINYTAYHTYSPGSYTACISIIDTVTLMTDYYCQTINVGGPQPANCASFSANVTGSSVQFSNTSSCVSQDNYIWDFGDGSSDTGSTASHTYAANGTYSVKLSVYDSIFFIDTVINSVLIGPPPVGYCASFNHSISGYTAQFTNTSSCANQAFLTWKFGDGTVGYGNNPWHTYAGPGIYYATLLLYDSLSNFIDSTMDSIVISNPPVSNCASFIYSVSGLNAQFTNTSVCPNQSSFLWKFGDGTYSSLANPSHAFPIIGTYNVVLSVYDSVNLIDSVLQTAVITGMTPCNAYFTRTQARDSSNNLIPGHVLITDGSTGNNLSYYWDFGDGNSSTLKNPSHAYSGNGPYILCLTVSDSLCSSTFCDSLTVDSNGMVLRSKPGFTIHVGGYNPPTSIGKVDKTFDMYVYPNPFNDVINVSIEGVMDGYAEVVLLDIAGHEIVRKVFQNLDDSSKISLIPGELPGGVYIVQLRTSRGALVRQMIKQ